MSSETLTTRSDHATRAGVEVELIGLHRHYDDVTALEDLSLQVAPGEFVALLGPSGCGKTTALRAVAGLEQIDAGQVLVGGRDITAMPANKRDMGMVFQAYSLFPNMSARDNVGFGLRLRRVRASERRRRADELLELVGLSSHAGHYPHQLSGGQQQRVAIARALAIQPKVLLLDEPLSALDAKVRAQLRDEIRRIQVQVGITSLFVTHDQEEALALADRVGVMRAGRLEQIAAPHDLYERPRTPFVAEFVGTTNRLAGVARDGAVEVLDTRLPLLDGSVTSGSVSVLVRPESVDVVPDEQGTARIATTTFLGAVCQAQVRLPDGTIITAQVPNSEIVRLSPGLPVRLTLHNVPVLAAPAT